MRREVRCAGCRRRIGFANLEWPGRIWCTDPFCPEFSAAKTHETRDDVAFLLYRLGESVPALAARLGITPSRIRQIIDQRSTS